MASRISPRLCEDGLALLGAELVKLDRPINEPDFRWTEPTPAKPKPAARIGEPALV